MPMIWITGLPGVGKSCAATAVVERLRERDEACLLLDGDRLRRALAPLAEGYDEASRRRLARAYANLAGIAAEQRITCVVATVSLFAEMHEYNRSKFARYLEVLLVCDDAERARRRPDAALGDTPQVGSDIVAEWPAAPDLVLDSGTTSTDDIATRIVERWDTIDAR